MLTAITHGAKRVANHIAANHKANLMGFTDGSFPVGKVTILLGITFILFSFWQIYIDVVAVPGSALDGLRGASFQAPVRKVISGVASHCFSNCSLGSDGDLDSIQRVEAIIPGPKDEDNVIVPDISLEDAFFKRMRSVRVSDIADKMIAEEEKTFKSKFLPNNNLNGFPMFVLENACMEPNGALLFINTTLEATLAQMEGPEGILNLFYTWSTNYACEGMVNNYFCAGYNFSSRVPSNHAILRGTTAHMLPYDGTLGPNTMHNWAERTWEYIMAASEPFNSTVPYPIDYYIIHKFDEHLQRSRESLQIEESLWQLRLVMEMGGSPNRNHILMDNTGDGRVVCFEKLILQQRDTERIDETHVPTEYAAAGVKQFRSVVHAFFGLQAPKVRVPPKKLRVLFYGRGDVLRRRIVNQEEVLHMLRNFSRPPLEIIHLDEMLATGQTNYSFLETIRTFSQTDILIIAHGANTWATFLLPEGAGVVEIFGPCNWSSYNYTDLRVMHTWTHVNTLASKLKHDISNPFKNAIANPQRGNTTACSEPIGEVPDYTVDVEKLQKALNALAYPTRPKDPLTEHWMYDWDKEAAM